MVTERPARIEELPYLQERLNESDNEKVQLYRVVTRDGKDFIEPTVLCWVTEKDGKITAMLPVRQIWQAEPLYVFPEVSSKSERRRCAFLLPRAMEKWLGDRTLNKTGIYSYFFVTGSRAWTRLALAFGCLRIYKGCSILGKDL
jgi:hypothetical protein